MSEIVPQAPKAAALLVCDRIINDQRTGQRSLIGLVNVIGALQFPVMHPMLGIYLAMSGGRGRVPCEFRLVQEDTDKPPMRFPAVLEFPPDAAQMEIDIMIQGIPLHGPGRLLVQFWAEDRFVAERLIQVRLIQPPAQPAGEAPKNADANRKDGLPGISTAVPEKKDFVIRLHPEDPSDSKTNN